MYCPLNDTHKKEIKHQILIFHYINTWCPIFVIPSNLKNPTIILETCPRNWYVVSNSMFFIMGGQHIIPSHEGNFHTIMFFFIPCPLF